MKIIALRLLAIGVGIVLLTSAYTRLHSASIMSDAAKAFLAFLKSPTAVAIIRKYGYEAR